MDHAALGGEMNQRGWWLVAWAMAGAGSLVSADWPPHGDAKNIVRLPRDLFTCLRWEFDTPQGLVRLPTQAKRWAVELSELGAVEIVCGTRAWSVRVE